MKKGRSVRPLSRTKHSFKFPAIRFDYDVYPIEFLGVQVKQANSHRATVRARGASDVVEQVDVTDEIVLVIHDLTLH